MFYPSTSRSEQVACATTIKTKNGRENGKRGYEVQIEGSIMGEKLQRERGTSKISERIHSQVSVSEAPNKIQKENLQLHFIPSLQSERIPVF